MLKLRIKVNIKYWFIDFNFKNIMRICSKKNKLLIWLLPALILFFLLNIFQKEVRGIFYYISAPTQKILWEAGKNSSNFLGGIKEFGSLKNKINNLELENYELITEIARLKNLEKENEILRKGLEIELQKEYNLAFGQIIGKDISQEYILIDKGLRDGISKELPIITEEKILIGKIIEVYSRYSKVALLSGKDLSFDVIIKQENKEITAVAQGQGNSKIKLNFIPQEVEIYENDLVFTSYLGGIFPENLLIGKITNFKKSDTDPFQAVEAKLILEPQNIKDIFIVLDF